MPKVCILNSTTNVVENVVVVDDINNVPSFLIQEGQKLATDHTGEIDETWNGSAYVPAAFADNRTDEEKWIDIREERNKRLAETDYYALSDVTMSTEMTAYRQSLRDLPSTESDPDNITWPTKP
tara:strand:- start:4550 stop:4921 length:372 start_codon:yes stop_codon:yes gene_type:complete